MGAPNSTSAHDEGPLFVKNAPSRDKTPEKKERTPEKQRKPSPGRTRTVDVDSCKLIDESIEKQEVYGVGRNFNRDLGKACYRTGGEMKMRADVPRLMAALRKNIIAACEDPEHCVRLFVQGSKFWFTDVSGEGLCDQILQVADSPADVKAIRLRDQPDDMVPCAICVVEAREPLADGTPQSVVQWLFRHDVVDGWRALRYLFTLAYESKVMTFDRLAHRYELKKAKDAKRNPVVKVAAKTGKGLAAAALFPAALCKLATLSRVNNYGERKKFYAHVVCDLEKLKQMGKDEGLGCLTNVLSATILEAYFAADPTAKRANVANAVLFNPDSPHGNHMCMKICSVARKGNTLKKTATALGRSSQQIADVMTVMVSRAYARGDLPARVNKWIEERQKQLDFLVSSLPGTESSVPPTEELHVCREFTTWAPNIIYCLGVSGTLCMDFYWEVRHCFDEAAFLKTLTTSTQAIKYHTDLPVMY